MLYFVFNKLVYYTLDLRLIDGTKDAAQANAGCFLQPTALDAVRRGGLQNFLRSYRAVSGDNLIREHVSTSKIHATPALHLMNHLLQPLHLLVQLPVGLVLLIDELDDTAAASQPDSAPAQLFELRIALRVFTRALPLRNSFLNFFDFACVAVD